MVSSVQHDWPTGTSEHERFIRRPIDARVDEADDLLRIAAQGTSPATPAIVLAGILAVLTPLVALLILLVFGVAHL
jgi:hypothetical protein